MKVTSSSILVILTQLLNLCFVALLWLATATPLTAQIIPNVDFTDIKKRTTDPASPYYFPKLLVRLQQADSMLQKEEYRYLYYGQAYAKDYNPYGADGISKKFLAAYDAKENERALEIGLQELAQHPLNMKLRKKILVCYHRLGKVTEGKHYSLPYYAFLYAIIASGDGHTLATAFVPVTIADEYEILSYYDLSWSKQALQGSTDVFTLQPGTEPPFDERHTFTGEHIYFDASRPLLHMAGLLKK